MLVLFETPAGFALFKLKKSGLVEGEADPKKVLKEFSTPEAANSVLKLKGFQKFSSMPEALAAITAVTEGKISDSLSSFLQSTIKDKDISDKLAVCDSKLGKTIKAQLQINCVHSPAIAELMRGIRSQLSALIKGTATATVARTYTHTDKGGVEAEGEEGEEEAEADRQTDR